MIDTEQRVFLHLIRAGDEVDGKLSEFGRKQAAALNECILRNPMYAHAAWSSTLPWAQETLELLRPSLMASTAVPFRSDDRLNRVPALDPPATLPGVPRVPNACLRSGHAAMRGERPTDGRERLRDWLHDAIDRRPNPGVEKTIVAVTHATAIRPLLQVLLDLPPALANHFHVDHTSVTSLRWLPRQRIWEVRRLNARPHLPHTSW